VTRRLLTFAVALPVMAFGFLIGFLTLACIAGYCAAEEALHRINSK